jgi:phosphate transport system substrate-binding protein
VHKQISTKEDDELNKSIRKWLIPVGAMLALALVLSSCGGTEPTSTEPADHLEGAGATFPLPLYTSWIEAYYDASGIQVSYEGIGSGGGIGAITAKTVDFAGSDAIMSDEEEADAEAAGGPILHIPMTSGAVAVIFNVPGFGSEDIRLAGDVLADIFAKTITNWNDTRITDLNADLSSVSEPITVCHRSDGSGTTYIFTNYLSKVSQSWSDTYGFGKSIAWAGDVGGERNAGVAAAVAANDYSIGYVELAYAIEEDLPFMLLKNAYGNWIVPTLTSTTASTEGVALPDDMKIMITNTDAVNGYPICGFTWVLAYENQEYEAVGLALVDYLWWCIHEGQEDEYSAALHYARLSEDAVAKAENLIRSIKYNGQQLLSE